MIGLASIAMTFPTMPFATIASNVMPQNLQVFIEGEPQQIQGQDQGLLAAAVVPDPVKGKEKGQNLEINIIGLSPSLDPSLVKVGLLNQEIQLQQIHQGQDQSLLAGLVAGLLAGLVAVVAVVVQGKDFLRYGRNTRPNLIL
mgnify:FL=1